MLTSMTGFGRGEASNADVAVVVELRAVNHRYLDVVVRSAREYLPFEPALQRLLKDRLERGRVEVHVKRQPVRSRATVAGDDALFLRYVDAVDGLLGALADREGREHARGGHEAVAFALSQPGVLTVALEELDVLDEEEVLMTAAEGALEDLLAMRAREGEALARDLEKHLLALLDALDAVEAACAELDGRLLARIQARMTRLLGEAPVESWRVAQEAALLSEKADVSEEVARLRSHAVQLRDTVERDGAVGRRLDFLLQEMNREVNTIGSKAVEHPVHHRVVEMKSILEKMREQAANVE